MPEGIITRSSFFEPFNHYCYLHFVTLNLRDGEVNSFDFGQFITSKQHIKNTQTDLYKIYLVNICNQ